MKRLLLGILRTVEQVWIRNLCGLIDDNPDDYMSYGISIACHDNIIEVHGDVELRDKLLNLLNNKGEK